MSDGFRETPSGARVLLTEHLAVKLHRPGTDRAALAARLDVLRDGDVAPLWVPPALGTPVDVGSSGRVATVWRRADVLDPGDGEGAVPWRDAGVLLARLHRSAVPVAAPPHGGAARLERAVARAGHPAVVAAGRRLLVDGLPGGDRLVHGDFHLGQLGRLPGDGAWRLLDVDDLGTGDPAWDLGRPAGFWAAGLLGDDAWSAFLAGYRVAGGPGVPPVGDPWPGLDRGARAAVVIAAGNSPRTADAQSVNRALTDACSRMPV